MLLLKWSGTVVKETVEYRSATHEDMPRKFLDIRFSDYPISAEKGQLRPFPAFRRGWVRAKPVLGQGTGPLRVLRAAP